MPEIGIHLKTPGDTIKYQNKSELMDQVRVYRQLVNILPGSATDNPLSLTEWLMHELCLIQRNKFFHLSGADTEFLS
jgi:hypothetical protein